MGEQPQHCASAGLNWQSLGKAPKRTSCAVIRTLHISLLDRPGTLDDTVPKLKETSLRPA